MKLKVLNPVVRPIAVFVMHDLCRQKMPANVPLHHKAMLPDIPVVVRVRMVWLLQKHIAIRVSRSTSAPERIALHR